MSKQSEQDIYLADFAGRSDGFRRDAMALLAEVGGILPATGELYDHFNAARTAVAEIPANLTGRLTEEIHSPRRNHGHSWNPIAIARQWNGFAAEMQPVVEGLQALSAPTELTAKAETLTGDVTAFAEESLRKPRSQGYLESVAAAQRESADSAAEQLRRRETYGDAVAAELEERESAKQKPVIVS